jgi:HEPN domain-containing protein
MKNMKRKIICFISCVVIGLSFLGAMPEKAQHIPYQEWIAFAQGDLEAAEHLIFHNCESQAMFYCAQAAEKSLKAYLSLKKHFCSFTHDLLSLLTNCENARANSKGDDGVSLAPLYCHCAYLSPLESLFRYPDVRGDGKTVYDAKTALKYAKQVFEAVAKKILWAEANISSGYK